MAARTKTTASTYRLLTCQHRGGAEPPPPSAGRPRKQRATPCAPPRSGQASSHPPCGRCTTQSSPRRHAPRPESWLVGKHEGVVGGYILRRLLRQRYTFLATYSVCVFFLFRNSLTQYRWNIPLFSLIFLSFRFIFFFLHPPADGAK